MGLATMQTDTIRRWTSLQKIIFRFFFVFLSLQVFTEGFLGILYRDTNYKIWNSIAERFTRPCLWLNEHFFHYKYIPQAWSTFSGALHTIRDIIYLFASVLACFIWTVIDRKRPGYNKLYYWFCRCLVIILSASVFFYGIIKVFSVQMLPPTYVNLEKPLGDLSPFWLAWKTFGYGEPFQVFCGIVEVLGAFLILFRRTRIAGLIFIAAVMVTIIMIDYSYNVGNVMITAFYMLLISLFVLTPYCKKLFSFLFTGRPVALIYEGHIPQKNYKTILFNIITVSFLGSTFISNTQFAYSAYNRKVKTANSARYSLVKTQVYGTDTLKPVLNDPQRWKSWFERVRDGKRLVTITTMDPKTDKNYRVELDTLNHVLKLDPLDPTDTIVCKFNYTNIDSVNWILDGTIQSKHRRIELQRIDPDTIWNLLKIKRQLIIFDDWSDQE